MADHVELARGENVVAVITFHESTIYPIDVSSRERLQRVVAPDPQDHFHKVHHHAGNPQGIYEADSPEYWRKITEALAPAGAILLLGHGKGHANATHHWVAYVEKHRKDVAAKVVADVRVDLDHLDDEQVLRLAQQYFDGPPPRDVGDGRWGEPSRVREPARHGRQNDRDRRPSIDAQLNNRHRDTLATIFSHPSSGNIDWRQVHSLLEAMGATVEEHNGKLRVTLGSETEFLHRPHGKDVDPQTIADLRRMLTGAGLAPDDAASR
jgi:hypothetical protein